jgi:hypothetical protein
MWLKIRKNAYGIIRINANFFPGQVESFRNRLNIGKNGEWLGRFNFHLPRVAKTNFKNAMPTRSACFLSLWTKRHVTKTSPCESREALFCKSLCSKASQERCQYSTKQLRCDSLWLASSPVDTCRRSCNTFYKFIVQIGSKNWIGCNELQYYQWGWLI